MRAVTHVRYRRLVVAVMAVFACVPAIGQSVGWELHEPEAAIRQQMVAAHSSRAICGGTPPVEARIDFPLLITPSHPTKVVLSVLPFEGLVNAHVEWTFTPGVVVLGGEARVSSLRLKAGEVAQFALWVLVPEAGEHAVTGSIVEERGAAFRFGLSPTKWIYIDAGIAQIQDSPRSRAFKLGKRPVAPVNEPHPLFRGPDHRALTPMPKPRRRLMGDIVTIDGQLLYGGHDGLTTPPAAHATVEAWDRDTFSGDDFLAEATTDALGRYSLAFNNGGDEAGGQDVYLKYIARNSHARIVQLDASNALTEEVFAVEDFVGDNIATGAHTRLFLIDDVGQPGGSWTTPYFDDGREAAFEILATIEAGWQHYSALGYEAPSLRIGWRPAGNPGSHYKIGRNEMALSDGDQFDAWVILHEMGHHILQNINPAGSPGGSHWLTVCLTSVPTGAMAWDEGFASYSANSTLRSPIGRNRPGVGDTADYLFNLEIANAAAPPGDPPVGMDPCPDNVAATRCEGAVACSLWDMFDAANAADPDDHDVLSVGAGRILDRIRYGGAMQHMMAFLNAYLAAYADEECALRALMSDHDVGAVGPGGGVAQLDTRVEMSDRDAVIGETLNLVATVLCAVGDQPIEGIPVDFLVAGAVVGSARTDSLGRAVLPYVITEALGVGDKTLRAEFWGDSAFRDSFSVKTLRVYAANTNIAPVCNAVGSHGQEVQLCATLTQQGAFGATYGIHLPAGKQLSFFVDGAFVGNAPTDANGVASLNYTMPEPGHYFTAVTYAPIQVTFPASSLYNGSTGYGVARLQGTPTRIIAPDQIAASMRQTILIQAALEAYNGTRLPNRTLEFAYDGIRLGNWLYQTDANGQVEVQWKLNEWQVGVGEHDATISYRSTIADDYAETAATKHIRVLVSKGPTTTTSAGVSAGRGDTVRLKAALRATNDNQPTFTTAPVLFKLGGATIGTGVRSGDDHYVDYVVPMNLPLGANEYTAEFSGDADFLPSSGTGVLTVDRSGTRIESVTDYYDVWICYTSVLAAVLQDSAGIPLIGARVTFRLDGVLVGAAWTNLFGFAAIPFTPHDGIAIGERSLRIEYAGDGVYLPSTAQATVRVSRGGSVADARDSLGRQSSGATLRARLRCAWSDAPLAGRGVSFSVDGQWVADAVTNADGEAAVVYFIPATTPIGVYPIKAEFVGDASYDASWWGDAWLTVLAMGVLPEGDVNGDGCVDDTDLTNVILDYGTAGGINGDTDIDDDGEVTDADLTIVILNYGTGC